MENGMTALFNAVMDRVKTDKYDLIGTHGMIEVGRAFTPHLFEGAGFIAVTKEKGEKRNEYSSEDQYKREVEFISVCILSNAPSADLVKDVYNNVLVMDACRHGWKAEHSLLCRETHSGKKR